MKRVAALVLLLFAPPAFAHAIRMKVEITDSHIQATVRYDGSNEDGSDVEFQLIRREPLQEIAKFKPGVEAVATFPRPEPGLYRMVAQDDFGHRVVVDFEIEDTVAGNGYDQDRVRGPSRELATAAGLGLIAFLSLAGWWITGRKKHHGP